MKCVRKDELMIMLYKECGAYSNRMERFDRVWEKVENYTMLMSENNNNGFKVNNISIISYDPRNKLFIIE